MSVGHFSVVNFERFQHYKDRNPPWIKLYNELLDDYEFGRLQDASKMHLIAIWLLASRTGNKIPYDAEWIKGRINATDDVDLNGLKCAGFIELDEACSKMLAKRLQDARPETETETETEKRTPTESCAKRTLRDPYVQPPGFNEWWEECPRKRSKGDAHKIYVKIVKDGSATEAELLLAMRAAKAYWRAKGTEDEHIPYPATWLRARGWEDDTTVRRKPTDNEQLQEWVNGTQGHDSERDTIDGEYVEVSGDGPSGNGGSLPLGPVGPERQGSGRLGEPLAGQLGQDQPAQASGHSEGRSRVQALVQKAAAGCSTRKKP